MGRICGDEENWSNAFRTRPLHPPLYRYRKCLSALAPSIRDTAYRAVCSICRIGTRAGPCIAPGSIFCRCERPLRRQALSWFGAFPLLKFRCFFHTIFSFFLGSFPSSRAFLRNYGLRLAIMDIHVLNHPLVDHKLTVLRDKNTPSSTFRELVSELVMLELTKPLATSKSWTSRSKPPSPPMVGKHIASPAPIIVPVLRAGLGMLDGMTKMIPSAESASLA